MALFYADDCPDEPDPEPDDDEPNALAYWKERALCAEARADRLAQLIIDL